MLRSFLLYNIISARHASVSARQYNHQQPGSYPGVSLAATAALSYAAARQPAAAAALPKGGCGALP